MPVPIADNSMPQSPSCAATDVSSLSATRPHNASRHITHHSAANALICGDVRPSGVACCPAGAGRTVGDSMVRMVSAVRFRRRAPHQTSSSGGVRPRSVYASRADSCRLPEICQSDLHTVSRCGPAAGTRSTVPARCSAASSTHSTLRTMHWGDRLVTPRRSSLGQRLGRLQTMLASRPASRASIGCRHRPGSAGATAGAASPGRLSTSQLGCRRDPRFCDSDLEADAIMLTILAVQRAVRELNRDACRPVVQSAAS
jgi:hypothetical protein